MSIIEINCCLLRNLKVTNGMNKKYNSIIEIAKDIKGKYENSDILFYAINGVGKTRLSQAIKELYADEKVLCYSTFFEEYFRWNYKYEDNSSYLEITGINELLTNYIMNYGDNEITKNFRKFVDKKIDINFEMDKKRISFSLQTGDDKSIDNIKISKGEEIIFIWTIFYTVLEQNLADISEEFTEGENSIKYIVIDDPVSSINDDKILTIALQIKYLKKKYISEIRNSDKKIGILIETHNKTFWNLVFNELNFKESNGKSYRLNYLENEYYLEHQNDSPFSYHLELKNKIEKDIVDKNIKKWDFNFFRNLLEKTASFYGIKDYKKLLNGSDEEIDKITRLINFYSHDTNDDLEDSLINKEESELFINIYRTFLEDYKWGDEINEQ